MQVPFSAFLTPNNRYHLIILHKKVKYLGSSRGEGWATKGMIWAMTVIWLSIRECTSISSLIPSKIGILIVMNLSAAYLSKKSIRDFRSIYSYTIVVVCVDSHLASTISSLFWGHGWICTYKVTTFVSIFCSHLVVDLWLSTKLYKNVGETNTIPDAAAKVDGWVGPKDIPTGFEVDVGDELDVSRVPSPYTLASRSSLCSSIIKSILAPMSFLYTSLGSVETKGSLVWTWDIVETY